MPFYGQYPETIEPKDSLALWRVGRDLASTVVLVSETECRGGALDSGSRPRELTQDGGKVRSSSVRRTMPEIRSTEFDMRRAAGQFEIRETPPREGKTAWRR